MTTASESELRTMLRSLGVPDADIVSVWGALESSERTLQRSTVMTGEHLAGYLVSPRQGDAGAISGRLTYRGL